MKKLRWKCDYSHLIYLPETFSHFSHACVQNVNEKSNVSIKESSFWRDERKVLADKKLFKRNIFMGNAHNSIKNDVLLVSE